MPGTLSVLSAMLTSSFTASCLFAVMYSFEAHCGLICRLHSFLSSHMYNQTPPKHPSPKTRQSCPLSACLSYPTCPTTLSAKPPDSHCKHSHIGSIRQVPNQRRERNNVCKGDSRSPTRPSEILVSIDKHICAPLDSMLPVQSRGKVVILLYLTNAGSSARAIKSISAGSYRSGAN